MYALEVENESILRAFNNQCNLVGLSGWMNIHNAPVNEWVIVLNNSGKVFKGRRIPMTENDNEYWEEFNSLNVYYEPKGWIHYPNNQ